MKVVIIKYNAGNVRSVLFALERIGVDAIVTDDHDEIRKADKVIFPGVGEASSAMKYLKERGLDKLILSLKQPVLGICLGMQLMCSRSEESNTNTECLGIFEQEVKKFPDNQSFKVPQIGWNNICGLKSGLFKDIPENSYMYFVHGYYVGNGEGTIAKTNYILDYSSALNKDNFYAVQFHPEKSGETGQKILENFIKM
ncbi:imidazole glycerol phosphate synthase subunit HisH [Paludibacter sp. 221]|uniref:imidazole glycerol phosphate synthase subunit HisH n=1 Tax=Paludibacter sp. 221 TaxID=2302939 RepID=UPI0013D114FD|nr:imidazole glycerol phosphate synthase subunit HisH [Paludibacter sp. 221]